MNQAGEPIEEETLFGGWSAELPTDRERDKAIDLLCEHIRVQIVRTNATKRGTTEIVLRPVE